MAFTIGQAITGQAALTPRYAIYTAFADQDGSPLDSGIALYFPGPHSFTGEDVLELQGHGGRLVLGLLLRRCVALGAREARPGEFSERAYLNDKMDLVQAEAIADLINAQTETAARQAQASLQGVFSDQINALAAALTSLRVYVEAAIDFPEEEIDFLSEGKVAAQLDALIKQATTLRAQAHQGSIVQQGATVVLAGKPNAGKSSLLNALAGNPIAIVTDQPGTTRDVVREAVNIDGVPLHLTDTAGLRETHDLIEQEGVRRARHALTLADVSLHLIDDSEPDPPDPLESRGPVITLLNKIDISGRSPGTVDASHFTDPVIAISTKTGAGLDVLKHTLLEVLGVRAGSDSLFSARARHIQALDEALAVLVSAQAQFLASGAGELLAEDLRRCHDVLGSVTGKMTSDGLLGEIFGSFCIGK